LKSSETFTKINKIMATKVTVLGQEEPKKELKKGIGMII
jgi:hypothetical protein